MCEHRKEADDQASKLNLKKFIEIPTCLLGVIGVELIRELVIKARIDGRNTAEVLEHDESSVTRAEFIKKRCIILELFSSKKNQQVEKSYVVEITRKEKIDFWCLKKLFFYIDHK
jgi:hypothetical protein